MRVAGVVGILLGTGLAAALGILSLRQSVGTGFLMSLGYAYGLYTEHRLGRMK